VWIVLNSLALIQHWDPYPFILLNLAFSTQAAYAAPLILLAETRQAERDRQRADAEERHREEIARRESDRVELIKSEVDSLRTLLQENTKLTEQDKQLTEEVARLTRAVHELLTARSA
jgi:uncharacterized membrane protein